ncbi:MAG: fused MFS/spermidine synthase [Chloracidobacterium sp.]|nr:fused MFS/spermidine synthase [Chloracidobacterium sp.]
MRAFRFSLEFAVFLCGALVMVYEIIGSRIVAPFIGTSTYVWTSLIGVILAALSLGYWLGGRMADRRPDVKILAAAIFFAGGLVSVTILIKDAVLAMIGAFGGPLELQSVAAAAILFAPASVLLGFVTPYAVKLRTHTLDSSGSTVGRLYALSTIGSIAGTFAAGFFLIPFVGSTRTLYLIAASLFLVSFLLVPLIFDRTNLSVLSLFALGIAGSELSAYQFYASNGLVDIDTQYSRVRVYQTAEEPSGREYRLIATDPYFGQSAMYLDDGSPKFEYIEFYHLVEYFVPDHKNVLMIGGAGYTFPREYLGTYPDVRMDVVEIDPAITDIARKYFRLEDDPHMRIFHEDGRTFLNRAPAGTYDAVMVDAFGSLFSIPFHLTTVEAVREMHRVLRDGGVVIINIGSSLDGPASRFLSAELATYRSVFAEVQLFKVRTERPDEDLQNVILVACKTSCRPVTEPAPRLAEMLRSRFNNDIPAAPALTDSLAPVEYYNSRALSHFRKTN